VLLLAELGGLVFLVPYQVRLCIMLVAVVAALTQMPQTQVLLLAQAVLAGAVQVEKQQ
jgi:hypothetical protein